jgi:hypothetical protein
MDVKRVNSQGLPTLDIVVSSTMSSNEEEIQQIFQSA